MTAEADGQLTRASDASTWWRHLLRSFFTLTLGEGAARVLGLATVLLLARRLGPGGFGLVAFGTSLVAWFGVVADAGTGLIATRDIARRPEQFRAIAERMLGLRLVFSFVAAFVLVGGAFGLANSTFDRDVIVRFAIALPAIALNLRWMVLGVHRARLIAFGNIAAQIVLLSGTLLLIADPHDTGTVALLTAGGEFAFAAVILALLAPRFGILRPRIDLALWLTTARNGLPLAISAFARGIIASFDLLVITTMIGPVAAGYYGAAVRPVALVLTTVGLFYVSFLASYSAADEASTPGLFRRSTRASLVTGMFIALVLSAGATLLMPLLFGHEFVRAAPVLAILAWKIPFSAVANPYNGLLVVEDQQMTLMWNNLAGAAINVVGDLAVAPTVGIKGVAAVNVIATVTVLLLNYRAVVAYGLAPRLAVLVRRS